MVIYNNLKQLEIFKVELDLDETHDRRFLARFLFRFVMDLMAGAWCVLFDVGDGSV